MSSKTWKSQAPAHLAVPSSSESNDQFKLQGPPSQPMCSSSSSPFCSPVRILTAESLFSPVDPGFLDGASSLARFGLDIGGTLCKVVYFEPCVDYVRDSSRSKPLKVKQTLNSDASRGLGKGKSGKETVVNSVYEFQEDDVNGGFTRKEVESSTKSTEKSKNVCSGCGNTLNVSSKEDSSAAKHLSEGLDQLTFTNSSTSPRCSAVHAESNRRAELGKQCRNGRIADEVSETWHCGCGTSGAHVSDLHKEDGARIARVVASPCSEDDTSSKRQAKKIWVSSHDPVHLPDHGTLYFKCFETWRMEEFLNLTKEYGLVTGGRVIGATGGGARKFGDQFLEIAGLQLHRADELKSLVRGIDFLVRHAPQESFEYPTGSYQGGTIQRPWRSPENSSDDGSDISSEDEMSLASCTEAEIKPLSPMRLTSEVGSQETHMERTNKSKCPTLKGPVLARLDSGVWMGSNEPLHPYLVVNIGSGVSILRVDSADTFERVGGTSLGGSTFLGLATALTGCQSFEEAISLAMQGDSTLVDMLVGDIYGGDYTEMGLAATTVASSFGKFVRPQKDSEPPQPQHLAKAVLLMVTNNIGSIAMLHARNAGVHSIMFTGSFLHNNKLAMRLLSVAMEFWSGGKIKAVFLRHEGHAGAMGALLSQLESSNPLDALLLI